MAGGIILMLAYGHKIKPTGDEYVRLSETIRNSSTESFGEYWVDSLPIRMSIISRSRSLLLIPVQYSQIRPSMVPGSPLPAKSAGTA